MDLVTFLEVDYKIGGLGAFNDDLMVLCYEDEEGMRSPVKGAAHHGMQSAHALMHPCPPLFKTPTCNSFQPPLPQIV